MINFVVKNRIRLNEKVLFDISCGTYEFFLRYFVAAILQFQLHRALCEKSGEYDPDDPKKPLHMCDIYQKQEAGRILK